MEKLEARFSICSLPDAIERNAAEVVTLANVRDIGINDLIGLRVQGV